MADSILVTGGAGFIGSHVCKALSAKGFLPIVLDNLSTGHSEAVKWGPLITADVGDTGAWSAIVAEYGPVGVIHLAAKAYVGESYLKPVLYYENNVSQLISFLNEIHKQGVERLVFSSSCSVYGNPTQSPVTEDSKLDPLCPYAETKVIGEWLIKSVAASSDFRHCILRYFNAAGCDPSGEIGESHDPETHLLPLAIRNCISGAKMPIFGTDLPTPDGTCLRDYVHVSDLADAHVSALERTANTKSGVFNLGSGEGHTVLSVCKLIEEVVGKPMNFDFQPRRKGDAEALFASNKLAKEELSWKPKHSDLRVIVKTAYEWIESGPKWS